MIYDFLIIMAIGIPLTLLCLLFFKLTPKKPEELKYFYDPKNWQD